MAQHLSDEQRGRLAQIEIPNGVLGDVHTFRNFDPERVKEYEVVGNTLILYVDELARLEAIQEFRSTIEAFRYEVERGVREETESFSEFYYSDHFEELKFYVKRDMIEEDFSAKMIELSVVEDALKYQLFSKKEVGVTVYYIDTETNETLSKTVYPEHMENFDV